ncbi:hypothetical protein HJG60_009743 [Phyllostomus discolor]|uniref:Uncharacterized protein n=1 Tax=Phyllostomus discolor TaxID=89673 RepID=A0A834B860_9CHIR|nr:hypothetical protein HJG60_009743 [Phyllostomus discolor]
MNQRRGQGAISDSLPITDIQLQRAVLPASKGHTPASLILYSDAPQKRYTLPTVCTTTLCSIVPALCEFFKVKNCIRKPGVMDLAWLPLGYGTNCSPLAVVPDNASYQYGRYLATVHILVALYRDSRDIHLWAAEYLFIAFKAAAGLNIMHVTYSQLEITVYLTKIATHNWAHQVLVDLLSTQVEVLAQPLIVQVLMIAKEAHMTAFIAIKAFLKEFSSVLILIPGVIDEIPKFREAWRHLEQQIGAELFPYAKAIRHQEAAKVTPSAFPTFASAALCHTTETSAIMKNYRPRASNPWKHTRDQIG